MSLDNDRSNMFAALQKQINKKILMTHIYVEVKSRANKASLHPQYWKLMSHLLIIEHNNSISDLCQENK